MVLGRLTIIITIYVWNGGTQSRKSKRRSMELTQFNSIAQLGLITFVGRTERHVHEVY